MKKYTNEKGITLIALIITIIVMLILVGVTINYSLNGGIITKAKEASEQTQKEADKESLMLAAIACMGTDGNIAFTGADGLDNNLPAGFSGSNGTYTKGGYTYTVNSATGEIIEGLPGGHGESNELTILGTYYQPARWGNASRAIQITDTKWIEDEEEFDYTIDGNAISVIYDEQDDNIEIFTINSDGVMFDYEEKLALIRSDATNINTTLLDGMAFELDNETVSFENGICTHVMTSETLTYTYVVYNGKVYSYEFAGEINYSGDEIISLTDNTYGYTKTYLKQSN